MRQLKLKIEDKDTPKSNLDIFVSIDEGYENVVDVTSSSVDISSMLLKCLVIFAPLNPS